MPNLAQPRSQGLSLKRETLVAAGHVPPRIWVVTKNSLKGGRLRLLLSILSLQESVKCCHQNKHFFHVAPVCCITVMSQCNTVQTPKKICTVDKILLRNNPPCGFGLSPRSRDQPQPGSLFSRSWGRGERDPGNEVNRCPRGSKLIDLSGFRKKLSIYLYSNRSWWKTKFSTPGFEGSCYKRGAHV